MSAEFRVITITLQLRHVCGAMIIIHGDDWDDLHGACEQCGVEFDFDMTDWTVEDGD